MPDAKISELQELDVLSDVDLFEVSKKEGNAYSSRKITRDKLRETINAESMDETTVLKLFWARNA